MSEQAVLDFLEATHKDVDLLARSQEATDLEAVIQIAQEAGYSLTEEDVKASAATLSQAVEPEVEGELGYDDLDAVAGGIQALHQKPPNVIQDYRSIFGRFAFPIDLAGWQVDPPDY